MSQLVDMCVRSKVLTLPFELNIDKWKTIDEDVKNAIFSEWHSIKFLNEDAIYDREHNMIDKILIFSKLFSP